MPGGVLDVNYGTWEFSIIKGTHRTRVKYPFFPSPPTIWPVSGGLVSNILSISLHYVPIIKTGGLTECSTVCPETSFWSGSPSECQCSCAFEQTIASAWNLLLLLLWLWKAYTSLKTQPKYGRWGRDRSILSGYSRQPHRQRTLMSPELQRLELGSPSICLSNVVSSLPSSASLCLFSGPSSGLPASSDCSVQHRQQPRGSITFKVPCSSSVMTPSLLKSLRKDLIYF